VAHVLKFLVPVYVQLRKLELTFGFVLDIVKN